MLLILPCELSVLSFDSLSVMERGDRSSAAYLWPDYVYSTVTVLLSATNP